jgi:hypothetical protein
MTDSKVCRLAQDGEKDRPGLRDGSLFIPYFFFLISLDYYVELLSFLPPAPAQVYFTKLF